MTTLRDCRHLEARDVLHLLHRLNDLFNAPIARGVIGAARDFCRTSITMKEHHETFTGAICA